MIKYAVAPSRRSYSEIRSLFSEILPDHQYVNYLNIVPDYVINIFGSMVYYDKVKDVKKYSLIEYIRKFYSINDLDGNQYWKLRTGNNAFPIVNTLKGVAIIPLKVIGLCFKYHC